MQQSKIWTEVLSHFRMTWHKEFLYALFNATCPSEAVVDAVHDLYEFAYQRRSVRCFCAT